MDTDALRRAWQAEEDVAHGTITMFGNDDFGHATQVASFVILIDFVVFRTMDEAHHVGILLDGSRFAEVAQLGAFAIVSIALLHSTVEL